MPVRCRPGSPAAGAAWRDIRRAPPARPARPCAHRTGSCGPRPPAPAVRPSGIPASARSRTSPSPRTDADRGAQIDQTVLEPFRTHLPATSRCSRDARSPTPCAPADRRSGRHCSGSARRNRPLFRRACQYSFQTRPDRSSAAVRCRNASANPPRRPRSAAGRSSSATRSAGRRCASPSSRGRQSADWLPSPVSASGENDARSSSISRTSSSQSISS